MERVILKIRISLFVILCAVIFTSCDSLTGPGDPGKINLGGRFDWRDSNVVTTVKHQGDYGTCWAFAVTGMVESLIKLRLGEDVDLSEQHVINRVPEIGPAAGLQVIKDEGIILENKLRYKGEKDKTYIVNQTIDYRIGSFQLVELGHHSQKERIDSIKSMVKEYGPVVSHMTVFNDLDKYRGGIYEYDGISKIAGGHIIIIVGWQDDSSIKNGGYWICKNSWGRFWGEDGFFRIPYDESEIAIYYICIAEDPIKVN